MEMENDGETSGSDLEGRRELGGQCGISAWLVSSKKKKKRQEEKRQQREMARIRRSGRDAGNPNFIGSGARVGSRGSFHGEDLSCVVELVRKNSSASCRHWKAVDPDNKLRGTVKKLRCQACHGKGKKVWNQEGWICLACMHIGCSDISASGKMRRGQKEVVGIGHAWQHWLMCNHPLAFLGGSNPPVFWCFACKSSPSQAMEISSSKKAMKGTLAGNIRFARTVTGLRNLGNTCFFNSAVQSLLSLDLLRDCLNQAGGEGGPLITSLRTLYLETTSTGPISSSEEPAENENPMKGERGAPATSNPEPLFTAICKRAPRFQGSRQQDSHELLKCLLDGLHSEEQASSRSSSNPSSSSKSSFSSNSSSSSNSSKKSSSISSFSSNSSSSSYSSKKSSSVSSPSSNSSFSSYSSSKLPLNSSSRSNNPCLNKTSANVKGILNSLELDAGILNHNTTIVERIFGGQLSSTVRCCDCGHTSVKHEPFLDLSLQIPAKQSKKSSSKTFFHQGSTGSRPRSTPPHNERAMPDPCSRRTLKLMLEELRSKRELRPLQGELQLELSSPTHGQEFGQSLQCNDGIQSLMDSQQLEKPALCKDSTESDGFNPSYDEFNANSERVKTKTLQKLEEMEVGQGLEEGNIDFKSPSCGSEEQDEDVDYLEGLSKLFQEEEEEEGHSTLAVMNGHCDAHIETTYIPSMSLQSCLADFTGLELLSGENAWECEHCKSRKRLSEKGSPMSQTKKLVGSLTIPFQGESLSATGAKRSSKGHAISRIVPNGKALASDSRSGMAFNSIQMNLTEGALTKLCSDDYSGKSHSNKGVKHYKIHAEEIGNGTGDGNTTLNELISKQKVCSRDVKAGTCLSRADHAVPFHALLRIRQEMSLLRLKAKSRKVKNMKVNHGSGKFVLRAATKRLLISRTPLVLIIHLKRFTQDHRGRLSKLGGHVSFPEWLDLCPFLDSKCPGKEICNYRLVGVVEHSGTMRGGHYVAYVRGPTMNQETGSDVNVKNDWYYISDSYVQKSSLNDVLKSEAYILLYEKKNI